MAPRGVLSLLSNSVRTIHSAVVSGVFREWSRSLSDLDVSRDNCVILYLA
jgi:hypothetical protein